MICRRCGANVPDDAMVCNFCGENLVGAVGPAYDQSTYDQFAYEQPVVEDKCTAVLVLGIVSLAMAALGCCGLSLVAFIPAIIGLVMAGKAKKRGVQNSNVKTGFILSLIALILSLLSIIGVVIYLALNGIGMIAAILSESMYY